MIWFVLVLLNILTISTHKLVLEDGHYWKNYENKIPGDALPCGLDSIGRPIYVGQVLHGSNLVPGKIYPNSSDIYYYWNTEVRADKNVKILCSIFPEQFEWIWTTPGEAPNLNKVLVEGGYEANYPTYIGRIFAGEETTIGKVVCRLKYCFGLYITHSGRTLHYEGPFQILTYNIDRTIRKNFDVNLMVIHNNYILNINIRP